ncbi:ribosome-associated translation inhibitor RaiA [Patescibacteria group bacterium]|nr:ribosome-associated translation inhibitor RaiA [Patescibacteria group bacterium]MBU1673718.1 ribosome-associated translation inhibitor RaiA [Patescibacteria group bacterium]MBU1963052.1 ribosome-associated translation inhibitor RaiA [Patescibacteria group bacterium]
MKIIQSARNIEITGAIEKYIDEKIGSLDKLNMNVIECRVELDKNTHHKKGEVYKVTVNMKVPGDLIRAEHVDIDVYAAIDLVKEDAERQLRKLKSKYEAKNREANKTRRGLKSIFFWRKAE